MAANHQWPSTCTDTQLSIIAETLNAWPLVHGAPASARISSSRAARGGPSATRSNRLRSRMAPSRRMSAGLIWRIAVEFRFAGAPLPVPAARCRCPRSRRRRGGPGRGPCWSASAPAGTGRGCPTSSTGRSLPWEWSSSYGHPGPHHFTRVREAVGGGGVPDARDAQEVAGILSAVSAPAPPRGRGARRCGRRAAAVFCAVRRAAGDALPDDPARAPFQEAKCGADGIADGA